MRERWVSTADVAEAIVRALEGSLVSKGLVVYFSMGGTTARVAESIATGLRAAEVQVDLCNLRDEQPPDPGGYDLLGVGSPTYYYRPSFNVWDHVHGLSDLAGLPAFAFVVYGTYRGDSGNALRQALAREGAQEVGYFACRGADYFHPYLKEGYLFSPDHPTAEELAQAEEFGREVARRVDGQEYVQPGDDSSPTVVQRLARFLAHRWLVENVHSRLFRVDKDGCTACGLCIEGCPTGNITEDVEGRPVWGRSCLACVYCEMNCPEEAITSPASWPLFRPLVVYAVRRASRDPLLDYVRVRHVQGRTERV
jgi:flavodoxin/Pyruvate/2-oxoacid:ferredoxin oxidoreductase delta subunit